MNTQLSRRKFCIGAAVLGGSVALASCSSSSQGGESSTSDALTTDVVVIGAGLAGMSCARAAAEGGASVILVDKAPMVGSTFSTSKGNVSICQIEENEEYWQFADTETDTMDAFIERYTKATETGKIDAPYPDYDRVKLIMTESCKTVTWEEEIGVEFIKSFTKEEVGTDTVLPDNSAEPDVVGGQFFNEKMQAKLEELGVELMLSTEATELVVEDGAVVGVLVDGGKDEIRAKAVVLATGGFGANDEYCDSLVPAINEQGFRYHGNPMNTGDAMTMAKAVDAAMYEDCWVIPNVISPSRALCEFDKAFDGLCDASMWGASLAGGATATKMLVNANGERFINEAAAPIALATTMSDLNAGPYYVLFDSSDAEVSTLLDSALDTGDVFKSETVEELAQASDCASLGSTFEAYQAAAASGQDEFGKAAKSLIAYGSGPFYLVKYAPSFIATMGGVKTNADCQAIREDDSAIDGLYVIGEATHRFMYNRSFVRHCSNQCAMTMGRMTGEALAQSIAEA